MIYYESSSFFFDSMNYQTSKYLMLIRPRNFSSNEETLESNEFQNDFTEATNLSQIREHVDIEFTNMVDRLSEHKIDHIVFDDIEDLGSPDAIFPNNWVHSMMTEPLFFILWCHPKDETKEEWIL